MEENKKNLIIILIILTIISIIVIMSKKKEGFKDKIYYFDSNSTTLIYDQKVKDTINKWISCGNSSNILHEEGRKAKQELEKSRRIVANDLKVKEDDIYFTSCATESNSIVIHGIVDGYLLEHPKEKISIITSNVEHPDLLGIFENYKANKRIEVIIVPVETDIKSKYYGAVNPNKLEEKIEKAKNKVLLVSIMGANNESGILNDIKAIGRICKKNKIFFHSDCTQYIPKFIVHPIEMNIDAITFSGHKFHCPKGVGVLYMRNNCKSILDDDSRNMCSKFCTNTQENHVRGGTENIAFISAIAIALQEVHKNREKKNERLRKFKEYIKTYLEMNGCYVITPMENALDNTLLVVLKGIDTCNMMFSRELSKKFNICISTSSACQTGEVSHVLQALKIKPEYRDKVIRISMSDYNTGEEVKYLVESIIKLLNKHRKTTDFNEAGKFK